MRAVTWVRLAACAALVSGCRGDEEGEPPKPNPPLVPMPPQSAEFPKSLVVQFAMGESTVSVHGVRVVPSRTHTYVGHPDEFRIALIDYRGKTLGEIATYDPRGFRFYPLTNLDSTRFIPLPERRPSRPVRGREGPPVDTIPFQEDHRMLDSVQAELVIPFVARLDSLRFYRPRQRVYPAFSVRTPLDEYCRGASGDPECQQWLRESKP